MGFRIDLKLPSHVPSLLVLLLFSAGAFAEPQALVRDSGRRAAESAHVYWVDEHHLLFEGLNGQHVLRKDGYKVPLNSLFLWNVETSQIVDYGEIAAGLCYANGYVRYRKWRTGMVGAEIGEVVAGELGKQTSIDYRGGRIDLQTCKPVTQSFPLPDWAVGKLISRLKPEHGFLVLGPTASDSNNVVTYHPKGSTNGIPMPFRSREIFFPGIRYSTFEDAYFIVGVYFVSDPRHPDQGYNRSPSPPGAPIPAWWLYPDGRTRLIKLPPATRDAAASQIFAMRPGTYYISSHHPAADGLFRVIDEDSATAILRGAIESYVVAPDGCQVALNHNGNYSGKRNEGTVKVVRVCASVK